MQFKNKIVFITGTNRGIGLQIAKNFLKHGAIVICTYRSKLGLQNLHDKLNKYGKILSYKLNITSFIQIKTVFDDMKKNNYLPDIIINNAGIKHDHLLIRLSEDNWTKVIETNLNAIFKISKIGLPNMIKKKWGRIINIGSVIGNIPNIGQSNYSASKAGIIGLSKTLALEVASRNITVNVVSPGYIKTDMTNKLNNDIKEKIIKNIPLQFLGTTQDIADTVLFLASEKARYITGQTLHVNGGLYMH